MLGQKLLCVDATELQPGILVEGQTYTDAGSCVCPNCGVEGTLIHVQEITEKCSIPNRICKFCHKPVPAEWRLAFARRRFVPLTPDHDAVTRDEVTELYRPNEVVHVR